MGSEAELGEKRVEMWLGKQTPPPVAWVPFSFVLDYQQN